MTASTSTQTALKIGTRIYTNLYGRGVGTIYKIHGEQSPSTVRQIYGGVMASGGSAEFDIVFDCGARTEKLPECILHGVQWRILDETVSQKEIDKALAKAKVCAEEKAREKAAAKQQFQAAIQELKTNPSYKHLNRTSKDESDSKTAVKNIRIELKKAFSGIKFSVRSDYNSVRINWEDGPTEDKVSAITRKYKAGSFNGMEDMYVRSQSPWTEVFGGIDYISTNRAYSDHLINKAIEKVFAEYPENLNEIQKPTASLFKSGNTHCIQVPYLNSTLQKMINQTLHIIE